MIFTIMLCVSSIIIQAFHPGIEPKSFEDTYQLESIGLNYYMDDKKNNISVIAIIEENPTNLTFSKNIVTFKTNSKIPNIYIEGIRYTEPNEQQDFWFWTGDYRRNKNNEFEDKYKKVVISLPKEFTQKNNQSVEVSSSTQKHETILEESNDGTISSQTKRNKIYKLDSPIRDMKDIYEVVKRLGGRIEECTDVMNISNGSIKKEGNNFVIYVLSFQSTEQKKHAIAHELGHLFLHMGYETNPDLWKSQENATYYRSGDPLYEYQANEFAAALLMPQKKYKEIMDRNTEGNRVNIGEIAKYFGVSVSAASNRGKVLGYLQ